MRGRKPKPTALRLAQGVPGHRAVNADEPKPRKGIGECPEWLDDEARRQWFAAVRELDEIGMLTAVDGPALAGYCQSVSRWRAAEERIARDGLTVVGPRGVESKHPAVNIS